MAGRYFGLMPVGSGKVPLLLTTIGARVGGPEANVKTGVKLFAMGAV